MKKILFLCLIASFSIFGQFANPKIVPAQPEFNFGDIEEGKIVEHNFVVYNQGGSNLIISKVKASCGCTAADPAKTELQPGDSTSVKVKFNSKGRRGPQRKYVYIFSNDPDTPQLRLLFTANVLQKTSEHSSIQPSLKLSEYSHNFGSVKEGEILNLNVEVLNEGSADLNINNVKASCGCTAAMLSSKTLKPQEKGELKVEFNTENLSGQVARTVTLFSNDPINPTRVLTLIANIEKG